MPKNLLYLCAVAVMGAIGGIVMAHNTPGSSLVIGAAWGAAWLLALLGVGGFLGRIPALFVLRHAAPSDAHVRELWTLATLGIAMIVGIGGLMLLVVKTYATP